MVERPTWFDGGDDAERFRARLSGDRRSALRAGLAWVDGFVPAARVALAPAGPLSRGRERAPGLGRADGGAVGEARGREPHGGLRFDAPVRPGGYAWWYVDALSEDGREGLTLIAFIGSVFSPYYAWTGRRDPADHCALNVALYGTHRRWAMTERGRGALRQGDDALAIGPSALRWDGHALVIDIDEVTAPVPSRIRGQVRLYPEAVVNHPIVLDEAGNHTWWPIAPCARVEVDLDRPKARWSGTGYFDSNRGDAALEATFRRWDWCRAATPDGTAVLYDLETRSGDEAALAILFDPARGRRRLRPAAESGAAEDAVARRARHAERGAGGRAGSADLRGRALLCALAGADGTLRREGGGGAREPLARPVQEPDHQDVPAVADAA